MTPGDAGFNNLGVLMQHTTEETHRIIEADYALNHQGREYDCDYVKEIMRKWGAHGGFVHCAPNVMFTGKALHMDRFEFHSVNGGSAQDLSAGVNGLLAELAKLYTEAVTFFDNPRIISLLKHSAYLVIVEKINEGQDRTYSALFKLRS